MTPEASILKGGRKCNRFRLRELLDFWYTLGPVVENEGYSKPPTRHCPHSRCRNSSLLLSDHRHRHWYRFLPLLPLAEYNRPDSWTSVRFESSIARLVLNLPVLFQKLCWRGYVSKAQSHVCMRWYLHSPSRSYHSFGRIGTRKEFCQNQVAQEIYPTCRRVCFRIHLLCFRRCLILVSLVQVWCSPHATRMRVSSS